MFHIELKVRCKIQFFSHSSGLTSRTCKDFILKNMDVATLMLSRPQITRAVINRIATLNRLNNLELYQITMMELLNKKSEQPRTINYFPQKNQS